MMDRIWESLNFFAKLAYQLNLNDITDMHRFLCVFSMPFRQNIITRQYKVYLTSFLGKSNKTNLLCLLFILLYTFIQKIYASETPTLPLPRSLGHILRKVIKMPLHCCRSICPDIENIHGSAMVCLPCMKWSIAEWCVGIALCCITALLPESVVLSSVESSNLRSSNLFPVFVTNTITRKYRQSGMGGEEEREKQSKLR
jgi:uncharacterized protein YggT (Ycf19 family)